MTYLIQDSHPSFPKPFPFYNSKKATSNNKKQKRSYKLLKLTKCSNTKIIFKKYKNKLTFVHLIFLLVQLFKKP